MASTISADSQQQGIIVCLNEFFSEVREGSRPFEHFELVQELASKLVGSVLVRKGNPDTFEDDVQHMLRTRLTFDEAFAAEGFWLVSKQRLQIVRRELSSNWMGWSYEGAAASDICP